MRCFSASRADRQELLTRPDLQVFAPPIGGMTVYIFGNEQHLSDPTKELTCVRPARHVIRLIPQRMHDQCSGKLPRQARQLTHAQAAT